MARARKPLSQQRGDLTEKRKAEMELQEAAIKTGKEDLEIPPEWLTDRIAKDEFRRVVRELGKLDLIGNLDLATIGAYANAYAGYVRASKNMKGKNMIVVENKGGKITKRKNPLIGVQEDYARDAPIWQHVRNQYRQQVKSCRCQNIRDGRFDKG